MLGVGDDDESLIQAVNDCIVAVEYSLYTGRNFGMKSGGLPMQEAITWSPSVPRRDARSGAEPGRKRF